MRQLYGENVRVKVVPYFEESTRLFAGISEPRNFYDNALNLNLKFGYGVDANWRVLGQINQPSTGNPIPLPTGNGMEDALEELALSLSGIIQTASAVSWPAVSFIPLSIYRGI